MIINYYLGIEIQRLKFQNSCSWVVFPNYFILSASLHLGRVDSAQSDDTTATWAFSFEKPQNNRRTEEGGGERRVKLPFRCSWYDAAAANTSKINDWCKEVCTLQDGPPARLWRLSAGPRAVRRHLVCGRHDCKRKSAARETLQETSTWPRGLTLALSSDLHFGWMQGK